MHFRNKALTTNQTISIKLKVYGFVHSTIHSLAVIPNWLYIFIQLHGIGHFTIVWHLDNGNKSVMEELKEVCNKIIGRWYSGDGTQTLVFSFTDQLFKQADLTIINKNKNPIQTHYVIGTLPQIQPTIDTVFYFQIGYNSQTKYVITSLTKDRMDVHIHDYYKPTETKFHFYRKIDESFADDILKGNTTI